MHGLVLHQYASVVNLNHPGHYLHWGVVQLSVANAVVIALMVVTFVAALFVKFPGRKERDDA